MPARLFLVATALLCVNMKGEASGDGSEEILAFVGETVILPCQVQMTADEDVPSVEWSKEGLKPSITFLYRYGCETFEEKNPVFHFRTNLFMEELKDGNLSLRLSDVRISDAGKYECKRISMASQDTSTIMLIVGAVSEPKLSVVAGGGTVQCEASCWFPMPEVTFLDALGNVVAAEEPKSNQVSRGGCFNVTRRSTVQTGNRVTCKVEELKLNQTRVTELSIPDDCMRSSILYISIAVVVAIILSAIIAFLWWKCCNSEGGPKLPSTQSLRRSSTSNNAEDERLIHQADRIQTEHRTKVEELESNLRDKDETIRRQADELNDLRSKQSPVEWQQPTICTNPSKSSQGVSKPNDLPPEQSPQDINPKPAASTISKRTKSVNFSQNKDSKPNISEPGPQIQISNHNNSSHDLWINSSAVAPAASPAFPSWETHVGRAKSFSYSLSHSNNGKGQRRSTISAPSSNRYSVLSDFSGDVS